MLTKLRDKAVEAVFLSSLSMGIWNTIMVSLILVTSNIDRIQHFLPSWNQYTIIIVFWMLGLFGMIGFSFFMDKVVGYARTYSNVANSRNPQISELVERTRRIEEKLEALGVKQ